MSHDGKYGITANNGDETISIIDTKIEQVAATLEAGPDMTGVNFAGGKAFVISSTSGFVYVYDMSSLKPAGRIRIGTNIQLETATTDAAGRKIYLAESTNHEVVIIDSMDNAIERVKNVGLYPVGHAHHGQQGQLLPLTVPAGHRSTRRPAVLASSGHARTPPLAASSRPVLAAAIARPEHSRPHPPQPRQAHADHRGTGQRADADAQRCRRPSDPGLGPHGRARSTPAAGRSRPRCRRRCRATSRSGSGCGRFRRNRAPRCSRPRSRGRAEGDRRTSVTVTLSGPAHAGSARYMLEIVTEPLEVLSVPNEAIIETGGKHMVYVQTEKGRYVPREIAARASGRALHTGADGLKAGEQVVTFGSFFIDADHKLKGS